MRKHSIVRAAVASVVLTLVAMFGAGCSDTNPAEPVASNGSAVLLGYQDEEIPFFLLSDPGTPGDPFDDQLLDIGFASFSGDTSSAVLEGFDFTNANVLRPYRREGTADFQRLYDFDVPASDRLIGQNTDLFLFHDPTGVVGSSQYFATALTEGIETRTSARTNVLTPWGRSRMSMTLNVSPVQRDSVLWLSFTPDPEAAFYILEIARADDILLYRDLNLLASLPLPVSMPHQFSGWGIVLPGQELSIHIPFYRVPFVRGVFPIALVVRVIALDARGRVVGRAKPDLIQRTRGRDGPNNLYELDSVGGWVMVLNPYPAGAGPASLRGVAPGVWRSEELSELLARRPAPPAMARVDMRSSLDEVARLALDRKTSPLQSLPIGIGQYLPSSILVRENR